MEVFSNGSIASCRIGVLVDTLAYWTVPLLNQGSTFSTVMIVSLFVMLSRL